MNHPPRLALWLLRRITHAAHVDYVLGDLQETFDELNERYGRREARRWYWSQALRSIPRFLEGLLYWSYVMLTHYLRITLRIFKNDKGYTLINVIGLAFGLACCILIVLYIQDERHYDRFHEKGDQIYRVVTSTNESGEPTNANGVFPLARNLKKDFAEVVDAARFRTMGANRDVLIHHGERRFYEPRFYFADSSVFEVFSFPLLQGETATALTRPNTIVLTEKSATKYFGSTNPIGQTLEADPYNRGSFISFEVTGVMQDVPTHSHLQFDFLASFDSQTDESGWGSFAQVYTYLLLAEGIDGTALEAKFPRFLEDHVDAGNRWYSLRLQPLTDIHLRSHLRSELSANGNIAYIYLFAGVAVFILLIASVNFINLTTARSARRAKEVGMRKVAGAYRSQLIGQFLGEALLLSALAVMLALLCATLVLPYFNTLADKSLAIQDVLNSSVFAVAGGIGLLVGLLAGIYPAFVLASFQPLSILKGHTYRGYSSVTLRKGLVVFQFTTSVVLMVATVIAYQQLTFIRTTDLGFDREQVLVVPLNHELRSQYDALISEVEQDPHIFEAAGTSLVPARGSNMFLYRVEGFSQQWGFHTYFVDHAFAETMGLRFLAGRNFDLNQPTDAETAFIINEMALASYGWSTAEDAIGKTFQGLGRTGRIVGVIEDMHIYSLRRNVLPMVLMLAPDEQFSYLAIRLDTAALPEALAHIEAVTERFQETYPFTYFFLDEAFEQLHRTDLQLMRVLRTFAGFALLIACLGLIGLATSTTEQRTQEIGIRKALGASVISLIALLSREVLLLVGIALGLAAPLAYFAMDRWLQSFAYQIDIGVGTFLLIGSSVLLIAWLTVAYQAIKTSRTNPIDALRYE